MPRCHQRRGEITTTKIDNDTRIGGGAALSGFVQARTRVDADTAALAAGDLDPAVVLDVASATVRGTALARVMETENKSTERLLDSLV